MGTTCFPPLFMKGDIHPSSMSRGGLHHQHNNIIFHPTILGHSGMVAETINDILCHVMRMSLKMVIRSNPNMELVTEAVIEDVLAKLFTFEFVQRFLLFPSTGSGLLTRERVMSHLKPLYVHLFYKEKANIQYSYKKGHYNDCSRAFFEGDVSQQPISLEVGLAFLKVLSNLTGYLLRVLAEASPETSKDFELDEFNNPNYSSGDFSFWLDDVLLQDPNVGNYYRAMLVVKQKKLKYSHSKSPSSISPSSPFRSSKQNQFFPRPPTTISTIPTEDFDNKDDLEYLFETPSDSFRTKTLKEGVTKDSSSQVITRKGSYDSYYTDDSGYSGSNNFTSSFSDQEQIQYHSMDTFSPSNKNNKAIPFPSYRDNGGRRRLLREDGHPKSPLGGNFNLQIPSPNSSPLSSAEALLSSSSKDPCLQLADNEKWNHPERNIPVNYKNYNERIPEMGPAAVNSNFSPVLDCQSPLSPSPTSLKLFSPSIRSTSLKQIDTRKPKANSPSSGSPIHIGSRSIQRPSPTKSYDSLDLCTGHEISSPVPEYRSSLLGDDNNTLSKLWKPKIGDLKKVKHVNEVIEEVPKSDNGPSQVFVQHIEANPLTANTETGSSESRKPFGISAKMPRIRKLPSSIRTTDLMNSSSNSPHIPKKLPPSKWDASRSIPKSATVQATCQYETCNDFQTSSLCRPMKKQLTPNASVSPYVASFLNPEMSLLGETSIPNTGSSIHNPSSLSAASPEASLSNMLPSKSSLDDLIKLGRPKSPNSAQDTMTSYSSNFDDLESVCLSSEMAKLSTQSYLQRRRSSCESNVSNLHRPEATSTLSGLSLDLPTIDFSVRCDTLRREIMNKFSHGRKGSFGSLIGSPTSSLPVVEENDEKQHVQEQGERNEFEEYYFGSSSE